MTNIYDNLISKFSGWLNDFIVLIPNISIAIIIVVIFFFFSRYLKKLFLRILSKFSENKAVNRLMANLLTTLFMMLGLFLSLEVIGLDKAVSSLLAGAGIIGLAVGLAFQDPILNTISGVIMSFKKPFNIGDTITSNGYSGVIVEISLRSTHIKSFTGEDIFIPNKAILQSPIENFTLTKWRRVDLECGISYSDDLELVQETAVKAITEHIQFDKTKQVEFIYTEFGDSSINFNLRYWLELAEEENYLLSKSKAIIALKKAFDKANINIPFPMRTLEFSSPLTLKK